MIALDITGFCNLRLEHLILDYNGTLAVDGNLLPGVPAALNAIAGALQIHVITADTFGSAERQLAGLGVRLTILANTAQADAKLAVATSLGSDAVVAIGNGRNDRKMLKAAALGIAVLQREGCAAETLANADVVAIDILHALELLQHPQRLIATLRS